MTWVARTRRVVPSIFLLTLAACSSRWTAVGTVETTWGRPIEGASVTVMCADKKLDSAVATAAGLELE